MPTGAARPHTAHCFRHCRLCVVLNRTVCLVTPGQPSTNPRLVKEADALVEAGYDVTVVAAKYQAWADAADDAFAGRDWAVEWVRFGTMASRPRDVWQRLRRRAARELSRFVGPQPGLTERAFHYVIPELTRRTCAVEADLYVAHNLAALPAAARAAKQHGGQLGFDAEDFHRGEVPDTPAHTTTRRLTAALEERYIPHCDYVTAAAPGIADEYARVLGIDTPTTILNVFPRSERSGHTPPEALAAETPRDGRSLHWFSQTIGPDRGLEDALHALPLLPNDVYLALRGAWASGYEDTFRRQAADLGVAERVVHLPLVPPPQVVERAAQHDVGLALEHPVSRNREICVTNKLFTYLLAGIPFVATETPGQSAVCEHLPHASRLYAPGNSAAFARATERVLSDPDAAPAARKAGEERYNWDVEKERFLQVVRDCL